MPPRLYCAECSGRRGSTSVILQMKDKGMTETSKKGNYQIWLIFDNLQEGNKLVTDLLRAGFGGGAVGGMRSFTNTQEPIESMTSDIIPDVIIIGADSERISLRALAEFLLQHKSKNSGLWAAKVILWRCVEQEIPADLRGWLEEHFQSGEQLFFGCRNRAWLPRMVEAINARLGIGEEAAC